MESQKPQKWYFTFGCGQPNAGYCQPIYAHSYESARKHMFDLYGNMWSFQYSEDEWEEIKRRLPQVEQEMEAVVSTFDE